MVTGSSEVRAPTGNIGYNRVREDGKVGFVRKINEDEAGEEKNDGFYSFT